MHLYWDDVWAIKGYDAAVEAARVVGHREAADRLARERDEFRADLAASLRASMAAHGIAYIPGAAELGDFDPTSTAIALAPEGDLEELAPAGIEPTYERYWREFVDRRDGRKEWSDYTPYELRTVGTFVRLGWRDRAQELLAFFFAGRCPEAWNQWAEVVGRNARQPRFVGDMPHGWVASDFIRTALDLFAYERHGDGAVVLAAGVPAAWLDGKGIAVSGLRTRYGRLSYSVRKENKHLIVRIARDMTVPPGGVVLVWPGKESPGVARVNGKVIQWRGNELPVRELPAEVVVVTQ
jgi:hypothetical protein